MSSKTLVLVAAAAAKNNGIGLNGDLPWRLRKELAYFTRVTKFISKPNVASCQIPTMNACILGRKSWESIPPRYRPLDGRYNIVVTRNRQLLDAENPPFSITQPSIPAALAHIDELNASAEHVRIDRVFVVGGASIYEEAMHMPDRHIQILLTKVHFDAADSCDAFFPKVDPDRFRLQPHSRLEEVVGFEVPHALQSEAGIEYEFQLFEKWPIQST
ncbi:dihydrofolate reductase [Coemansia sp. RSA 988]|nr:dihydrofolate reductase [Coemansia sp. RSA 988]